MLGHQQSLSNRVRIDSSWFLDGYTGRPHFIVLYIIALRRLFFANGNLCKIWQLQVVKNPPASAGDARELGSIPGVGDGNPLQ